MKPTVTAAIAVAAVAALIVPAADGKFRLSVVVEWLRRERA